MWNSPPTADARSIDLSVESEPLPPDVEYFDHWNGAGLLADGLDDSPRRTDVPLVSFSVEIEDGSAGWVRPVAFVEGR